MTGFADLQIITMKNGQEIAVAILLTCGGIWCVARAVNYILRKRNKKQEDAVQKVLFFPDPVLACGAHFSSRLGCPHVRCTLSHDPSLSYAQFLSTLSSVKYHLDVCLFTLTNMTIGDLLERLQDEGVKIRILTDQDESRQPSTLISKLRQKGIEVRHNTRYLMHHKFSIVDKKLLITGSFNWTMAAANGNYENLIITDNRALLDSYSREFEDLWRHFDVTQSITDSSS